jgi:hypothetical protein
MKVVALDPGGTTGWASYDLDTEQMERRQLGPGKHHGELYATLCVEMPDVLVVEDFRYRQQANAVLVSVEYIGVSELFVAMYPDVELVRQGSDIAHGSGTWDDDKVKKLNLWIPGQRHAMDATIHLLHFLSLNKKGPKQTAWYYLLRDA